MVAERELLTSGQDSHKVVLYFETIDGLYKLSDGVAVHNMRARSYRGAIMWIRSASSSRE